MTTIARLASLSLLLFAAGARAEDACRADVERLCPGIPPGSGRITACLKAMQADVSKACKAELATVARKVKEVGAACADDVRSWCADVKPGQGDVLRCLAANESSLAPACRDVLPGAKEKAAEFRKACSKDAKAFCKGIRPGEGRILACLKSRSADLSPACQALVR